MAVQKDGSDGLHAAWFWFDSDSVTDDPHDSYSFFVVAGDRIVSECITFSDHHDSGFDPSLFEPTAAHGPIWFSDADWKEAWVRLWYRRFYKETRIGQLMTLRPDEPRLHYYEEGRWRPDVALELVDARLTRIESVLWALAVIGCVIVYLLWK